MGSASFFAAITSTFWGSLTHRYSPKSLYLIAVIANAFTFFLMGFTVNLSLLLLLRIIQGLVAGISTIGLIIVSSLSPKERVSANFGLFQSFLTLGLMAGPPLGSLGAVTLGYRGAFVATTALFLATSIFFQLYVPPIPRLPRKGRASGMTFMDRRIVVGWFLCFMAQVQLMFMPSILPNVFETLKIKQTVAIQLAGTVVMLYSATAMIGTYVFSWLSKRVGVYRMITFLVVGATLLQVLLSFSRGVVDFTVIRMVQTGLVAATFPLIISLFVEESKGSIIGFLNSARYTGNGLGPFMATAILAGSNLTTLYFTISGITFLSLLVFRVTFRK